MTILPREQLVQRRDATVAAPGVVLWHSTTNLTTCDVQNIDLVTEGEVEEAQMAPPEWFWDVIVYGDLDVSFGDGSFGEEPFGEGGDAVDGVYIGTDTPIEWQNGDPFPFSWGNGNVEDGVYP